MAERFLAHSQNSQFWPIRRKKHCCVPSCAETISRIFQQMGHRPGALTPCSDRCWQGLVRARVWGERVFLKLNRAYSDCFSNPFLFSPLHTRLLGTRVQWFSTPTTWRWDELHRLSSQSSTRLPSPPTTRATLEVPGHLYCSPAVCKLRRCHYILRFDNSPERLTELRKRLHV